MFPVTFTSTRTNLNTLVPIATLGSLCTVFAGPSYGPGQFVGQRSISVGRPDLCGVARAHGTQEAVHLLFIGVCVRKQVDLVFV